MKNIFENDPRALSSLGATFSLKKTGQEEKFRLVLFCDPRYTILESFFDGFKAACKYCGLIPNVL